MTLNPAFYRQPQLSVKATIALEKYENTPATKEEIEYAKYSDRIYREACERSAKALKGIRAGWKKEAKEKKKLAKKKEAEKKLKAKKISVKKKTKSK